MSGVRQQRVLTPAAPSAEAWIRELVDQGRDASLRIRRRREDETFGQHLIHIHVQVDQRIAHLDLDAGLTCYPELLDQQACRVIRYVLDPATAPPAGATVRNCCPR